MVLKFAVLLCALAMTAVAAFAQGANTPAPPEANRPAMTAANSANPASNANIPTNPDVRVIEQIVAKVNNEIITRGELERLRRQIEGELEKQKVPPEKFREIMNQAQGDLLRDKIDELLLVQKARDLSINVDSEVSKQLAEFQLQAKITDPDEFQQLVRRESGMSFEDFKQQMKDGLLRREVIRREVGSRISIPRAELQKYYEEHKNEFMREEQVMLREILLTTQGKDAAGVAAVDKKAKDLVARARKNENFANLARDNSEANTAQNYGELPPFKRGMLKKDIEELVFKAEKGWVSDPIKMDQGALLILKVEEHYQEGLQPFEAVENEIMEKLYSPRMQPAMRTYLTRLRQEAFLQIREGYTDSGAAPGKDTSWKEPAKLVPQTVTKEEVAAQPRRKRLLWLIPIPGTKSSPKD